MLSLSSGKAESCFAGGAFLIYEVASVAYLILLQKEKALYPSKKAHEYLVFASALIKIS